MHFNLFQLLLLPLSLLLFLLHLQLRLLLLILLFFQFTFCLVPFALFLSLLLLLLVLLLFQITFDKGLLCFFQPQNVSYELLFDFIVNHLSVVLFLGCLLLGLDSLDFISDFGLFILDLIELLLVNCLCVFNCSLLAFYVFDLQIYAIKRLFNFWQLLRILLLLLSQVIYFALYLQLLFNCGSRICDLVNFLDQSLFLLSCHRGSLKSFIQDLFAFFQVFNVIVCGVALLGKLLHFSHKVLNFQISGLSHFHDFTLLCQVYLLLIEDFLHLSPHCAPTILLVIHVPLFLLKFQRKVTHFLVQRVYFFVAFKLMIVVRCVVWLSLRLYRKLRHYGFVSDVYFRSSVAPFSSHKFLVL